MLSNAFKYTLTGSIMISATSEDNNILLTVKDTGIGITEKEIPKISAYVGVPVAIWSATNCKKSGTDHLNGNRH